MTPGKMKAEDPAAAEAERPSQDDEQAAAAQKVASPRRIARRAAQAPAGGAAQRAGAAGEMQGMLGNRRVGEILQRGLSHPYIQRQRRGGRRPRRRRETAPEPPPQLELTPQDERRTDMIRQELERFRRIPIDVHGTESLPAGRAGPSNPVAVRVYVRAAYYISDGPMPGRFADARRQAHFDDIVAELRQSGEFSLLTGGHGRRRSPGQAVELGKSTPDDIRAFVEAALRRGIIHRFAVQRGDLDRSQQLTDLPPIDLQAVIQEWIFHTGVGVDCSGFVQQTAIRVREMERAQGETAVPPPIRAQDRGAAQFAREPEVDHPYQLRPGDVWVMAGGGHIRMVSAVRQITTDAGEPAIEFETAESTGGARNARIGPVGRTWRTRSLRAFFPMPRASDGARPRGGSFHRIR
jgi:hypothetical protein